MKYYAIEIFIGKESFYTENNINWFRLQLIKIACKLMPMHVRLKFGESPRSEKNLAFANYKYKLTKP